MGLRAEGNCATIAEGELSGLGESATEFNCEGEYV